MMLSKCTIPVIACGTAFLLVLGGCERAGQEGQSGRDRKLRHGSDRAGTPPVPADEGGTDRKEADAPEPTPREDSAGASAHDIFIAECFKNLSGEELTAALAMHVLAMPGGDWAGMMEFVRSIPPGEHVGRSFGTAMRRLVNEHPELWPDKLGELKGYLTKRQLDQMAGAYGEKLGKSTKGLEVLKATQDREDLTAETRIAFSQAFLRNQGELEPVAAKELVLSMTDVRLFAGAIEYTGKSVDTVELKGQFLSLLDQNAATGTSPQDLISSAGRFGGYLGSREGGPPHDVADKMSANLGKRLIAEYFHVVGSKDLNTALAGVAEMPKGERKDAVIVRLLGMVDDYDPEVAKAWVAEISDPMIRKGLSGE